MSASHSWSSSHPFHDTGAREVSRLHAYRLHGCWFIDWQTDDLNEWSERIKCILSFPLILFPFTSIFLSKWGRGLNSGSDWGGAIAAGCTNQFEYDYYQQVNPSRGWCLKSFNYTLMQLGTDKDSSRQYNHIDAVVPYHHRIQWSRSDEGLGNKRLTGARGELSPWLDSFS